MSGNLSLADQPVKIPAQRRHSAVFISRYCGVANSDFEQQLGGIHSLRRIRLAVAICVALGHPAIGFSRAVALSRGGFPLTLELGPGFFGRSICRIPPLMIDFFPALSRNGLTDANIGVIEGAFQVGLFRLGPDDAGESGGAVLFRHGQQADAAGSNRRQMRRRALANDCRRRPGYCGAPGLC